MSFGENLKLARKNKGYTQKELADLIHAKHNSISNWENNQNKPDPDTIEILCGVLGIKPNFLFNQDDELYTLDEENMIKRYRLLDQHGREVIDQILELEVKRVEENKENYYEMPIAARSGENGKILYSKEDILEQNELLKKKYPELLIKKD